ncbi:hypothetical protein MASR1M32_03030 [Rhodobacter sp.]
MHGGESGAKGLNWMLDAEGTRRELPSKGSITLKHDEVVVVETPGGGGWGKAQA